MIRANLESVDGSYSLGSLSSRSCSIVGVRFVSELYKICAVGISMMESELIAGFASCGSGS